MLDQIELETAKTYQIQLDRIVFEPCGFKHDFAKADGSYLPFCIDRESRNLGCAHVQDQAIRATIGYLEKHKIITKPEHRKLIEALTVVNLDLAALDNWTQQIDSLLREHPKIGPQAFKKKLEQQGLNQARFIASPELLKLAPKEEQEIVVLPKIYLKEQLSRILVQMRAGENAEAKLLAKALVIKMDAWIQQSENEPIRFDWSLN